ncbi:hypothetical protein P170DRAFT_244793 [Aspergillus steynii IBT 23096]|uniref:Uncharacterized protein n=1 Tax=Aspergillus steynii IBT 23096 TaxID=1392250 RepID=A0A2I2FXX8_9EURO|nr:uncharacterized protein P170DRAFT_244793 [Aspergillus steynii IBT 23096]PLB45489.1 hypothetical protein P170DRAFT_244793 [Aspergillus steynii IBT 23096]
MDGGWPRGEPVREGLLWVWLPTDWVFGGFAVCRRCPHYLRSVPRGSTCSEKNFTRLVLVIGKSPILLLDNRYLTKQLDKEMCPRISSHYRVIFFFPLSLERSQLYEVVPITNQSGPRLGWAVLCHPTRQRHKKKKKRKKKKEKKKGYLNLIWF